MGLFGNEVKKKEVPDIGALWGCCDLLAARILKLEDKPAPTDTAECSVCKCLINKKSAYVDKKVETWASMTFVVSFIEEGGLFPASDSDGSHEHNDNDKVVYTYYCHRCKPVVKPIKPVKKKRKSSKKKGSK
jgi:hypothetical protein